jgi:hypothetical protein
LERRLFGAGGHQAEGAEEALGGWLFRKESVQNTQKSHKKQVIS